MVCRPRRRLTGGGPEALLDRAVRNPALFTHAERDALVPSNDELQKPERMDDASTARRRARGMPLHQRLRLVALRLDAGLRETPQRFLPIAHHVAGADRQLQGRLLQVLIDEVQQHAVAPPVNAQGARDLLACAREVVFDAAPGVEERRRDLASAILAAELPRQRRRHIHSHGAVTADRRLLFLRSLVLLLRADRRTSHHLWLAIAHAISDYDRDHFVLQGAHIAVRVRRLADWIEREMSPASSTNRGTVGRGDWRLIDRVDGSAPSRETHERE